MKRKPKSDLAERVKVYLRTVKSAKAKYDKSDEILVEIAKNWPIVLEFVEIGKKKYELVDQFVDVDKVWGHGSVRRWDIRPLKKMKGKLA